jgi:hypothetical protein
MLSYEQIVKEVSTDTKTKEKTKTIYFNRLKDIMKKLDETDVLAMFKKYHQMNEYLIKKL